MSLQANVNAMLGSIAALKKLGKIQKGIEGTREDLEKERQLQMSQGQLEQRRVDAQDPNFVGPFQRELEAERSYALSGQAGRESEEAEELWRSQNFDEYGYSPVPPRSNAEAAVRAQQHIQDSDTAPNSGTALREYYERERARFSVGGQGYPFMIPGQVVPGTIRPGTISASSSYRTQRGADTSNLTGGNT